MAKFSKPKTRKDAVTASRKNSAAYKELIESYSGTRKLTGLARKRFEAMCGQRPYSGPELASDIEAKDELRKQLIFHLDAWQRRPGKRRFFFVTLMSDEFRCPKDAPHLWLKSLWRKADKTLRDLGLQGVGMIEACPVLRPPDTQKPELCFHAHAICWTEPDFDLQGARAALKSLRGWTMTWGIPAAHIHEITPSKGVAAWWGYYMAKHGIDAKNVEEGNDGRLRLLHSTKAYRGDFAVRLLEGLSQIALRDLIFSVGDGKEIRDAVMRKMRRKRRRAHPQLRSVRPFNVRQFWKRFWAKSPADHRPWFIAGSSL